MDDTENTDRLVGKGPCDDCGSSDACCTYEHEDGSTHTHCFSCDAHHDDRAGGGAPKVLLPSDFARGDVMALPSRNLLVETCRKFDFRVGKDPKGKWRTIMAYRDPAGMEIVAQKLGYADDPDMRPILGNIDRAGLYGQHLWPSGGKRLVITEGEIDAMSVSQVFNNTWPVVSIKRGCKGAVKDVKQSLEWVESFKEVVIWFDNDAVGKAAAQQVAGLLRPGIAKIAETPT